MLFNNQVCKDRQKMERYFKTDFKSGARRPSESDGEERGAVGTRGGVVVACFGPGINDSGLLSRVLVQESMILACRRVFWPRNQ